jgi:hypothetical protein
MYGMAQAVGDLIEQGAPAFDAAVPILLQLLKAEVPSARLGHVHLIKNRAVQQNELARTQEEVPALYPRLECHGA